MNYLNLKHYWSSKTAMIVWVPEIQNKKRLYGSEGVAMVGCLSTAM